MIISLIAAMAENRVIGRGNSIPWNIPSDQKRFREITMGHPIIFGRKTYDEIGLAFEDMVAGRIDGVVCDEPTAAHFALQRAEYKAKFAIAGQSFTEESYGIVVQKGDKELVDLLNKGIRAAKAKKIDEQLKKKWLR